MANGLPTTRDQASLLGASAIPTGRVQPPPIEFEVPDASRVAAPLDISLPDFNASPELLSFATPEPSARAAQPRIDFDAPTPLTAEETIEFEPEALSARAQLVEGLSPEFEGLQVDVADLSRQEDDLFRRGDEIAFSLGTEKRPKKRAEFEQEAEDNLAARAANQQKLGLTRGLRDREQAKQTARIGDAIAGQERRTVLDIEETRLSMEREGQLDDEARAEAGRQAEQELRGAKERHAQIIERGPARPAFATTAIAMFTEALKPLARPDGTADFGGVVDRLMRDSEAQWSREVEAAKLRTQIEGDDIGNIGRARKEELLQRSVIRELTARELQLETDKLVAGAQDDFSRARAVTISDELKRIQAEENAKQQALAQDRQRKAALDAQKFRKGEAEIELIGAKVTTEDARALELARKAEKAAGRGRAPTKVKASGLFGKEIAGAVAAGELDEKGAKLVFTQGVIDPVSGQLTRRRDGSFALATSPSDARELNRDGAKLAEVNSLVNEALAIRGARGWEPTSKWFNSAAGKRMKGISTSILLINKDLKELGILSGDDIPLLESIQGGNLAGLEDPRPTLKDMRRRLIAAYDQKRKSLAPGSQPLAFSLVTDAPTRTLADVDTLLNQSPNLKSGDVVDADDKLAAADEKFELLVEANNGDIRAASEQFTKDVKEIVKRANADRGELVDAFLDSTPPGWNDKTRAAAHALFERQSLPKSATGKEINAAIRKEKRALRAAENALSPRAKRLRSGLESQGVFIDELERKAGGELARQAESRKLDEQRKVDENREIRLGKLKVSGGI